MFGLATPGFTIRLLLIGLSILCYSLVAMLLAIFSCRPVNAAWDPSVHGTCINFKVPSLVLGVVNPLVYTRVLIRPIREVLNNEKRKADHNRMKPEKKMRVFFVFSLGGL